MLRNPFTPQFCRTLVRRFFALTGLLIIFLIVAQSTILPGVVDRLLHRRMSAAGFPIQSLVLRSLSRSHAVFSAIVAGNRSEITIDTLQLDYSLRGLLQGRLKAMDLSGASITLPWDSRALLPPAKHPTPSALLRALPSEDVTVSSSSLLFIRNDTRFRIPFDASISHRQDQIFLAFRAELLGGQTDLSATASPQGEIRQIAVSLRGFNPGLLPAPFLPAFFTAPLQGAFSAHAEALLHAETWNLAADINFHLAGEYRKTPFAIEPARLEIGTSLNRRGMPEKITMDLACEEARLAQCSIRNFSAQVLGDDQSLTARMTGTGAAWTFKNASLRLTAYRNLLKQLILRTPAASPAPTLRLVVNDYALRLPATRAYIGELIAETEFTRETAALHPANLRLAIRNGRLTGKNMLIDGIATTMQLDELIPLTTREIQQATISQAVFGGITLTNGTLLYHMESPQNLLIERCEWDWCGGRISSRSFSVPLDAPEIKCTAFFEKIALDRLAELLLPGQLEGAGNLFGRLPIHLRLAPEPALTFGKGYLYAVPSYGSLKIRDEQIIRETLIGPEAQLPPNADAKRGDLIREALRDYRFNLLKINFERIRENGLSGAIQLRGNGPPPRELPIGLTIPFAVE